MSDHPIDPRIAEKLAAFSILLSRLDAERDRNGGRLSRNDWWCKNYYMDPYLAHVPDDYINERWVDVFNNTSTLSEKGQIEPLLGAQREFFQSRFVHLVQEMNYRPGLIQRTDLPTKFALKPTFPDPPPGAKILRARALPPPPYLIKLGKAEHLRSMFSKGTVRIAPASFYSDPSLNAAINDDELSQSAFLKVGPLDANVLQRDSSGPNAILTEYPGNWKVTVRTPSDYYVSCFASAYDYRLVDDFEADAMIVILDRDKFLRRLARRVAQHLPDWRFQARDVNYFDPFFVHPDRLGTGFAKHFRYSYQQEFRLTWSPSRVQSESIKPIFVSIGPLRDFAMFYSMPSR